MTRLTLLSLLALIVASANGFAFLSPSARAVSRTKLNLMTTEEVNKLMTHATDCSEGECSIDEVTELIAVLKDQQKELYDRVDKIKGTIEALKAMNEADNRKVDEVKETVRAIFRVFMLSDKASGNDYPSLMKATGWSGEVGDGPKTAYDALPPKKWKGSS